MFRVFRTLVICVLAIAIIICYFQAWIQPNILGKGVFLGFAFPYIWALGIVTLIILLFTHSKIMSTLLVASLLITSSGMLTIIRPYPVKNEEIGGKKIRIVTANICNLRGGQCGTSLAIEQMKELFADADIVFLQEAPNYQRLKNMKLPHLNELFGFEYEAYDRSSHTTRKTEAITQVILSRYPITVDEPTNEDTDLHVMSAYANIDSKKVRLINCHLESIRLSKEQINTVNDVSHAEIHRGAKSELHETYSKMRTAFERRTAQTLYVVNLVKCETEPTIVGGDFNDTPISYTYHKMSQLLFDTFRNSSLILGNTFNGDLPPIRIDYIFHSADFYSTEYEIHSDKQCSDHFAVSSTLWLKN